MTSNEGSMTTLNFDWANDLPMAVGIFRTSDQKIVAANPAAAELFGWTTADIGSVSLWDLVAVVDWSLLRLEVARTTNDEADIFVPASGHLTFQKKDLTKFPAWFQVKDLPSSSGKVDYRVAITIPNDPNRDPDTFWDLKAKKDQEALVSLFSGTAAHEVNNALAVIYGLLNKSKISPEDLAEIVRPLDRIKRIGKVLAEVGTGGFDVASLTESDQPHEPSSEQPLADVARSVLLVDDQPVLLDVLSEALHATGYEVVKAKNLQEARQHINAQHFDCAVIDVQLGDELGTDLAFELQQSSPSTQIVLMSGFSHHFERYKDTLDMQFLRKPFAFSALFSALATGVQK